MKFTIERSILLKSLGHVQNVVERRNTIPILSNVKIEARSGALRLNATDMDIEVVENVSAQVKVDGSVAVAAHILYDIIRKLPEGSELEIASSGEGQVELTSGRSQFKLPCLPVEEFPIIAGEELEHSFVIEASELRALIDKTRFAISTEETRYYLNGIFLHKAANKKDEVLRSVSTDGHRLALAEIALPSGASSMPGIIIPRKTVAEFRKLIDETEDKINIHLSNAKIRFEFERVVLTSKLIDGTFPDYERVIPTGNDKDFEVDRNLLSSAVDRVAAISNEKSRAIKLSVNNSRLVLSASSPGHGSATEEMEIEYKEKDAEIGFNAAYLMDIMRQIESGIVQISFYDAASPTILRGVGDPSTIFVLMPMRV